MGKRDLLIRDKISYQVSTSICSEKKDPNTQDFEN